MDVQEVVKLAKSYVADVFQDEQPSQIGLEEIEFDEQSDEWDVTIGFSRPWSKRSSVLSVAMGEEPTRVRSYKIVRIRNNDGKMVAIKLRPGLD